MPLNPDIGLCRHNEFGILGLYVDLYHHSYTSFFFETMETEENGPSQTKSKKEDNEAFMNKIEELNQMISLQQYFIDLYKEQYEEEKEQTDALKKEIKRIHVLEQENVRLKERIKKQHTTIYHLQNPSKWQWCDFEGHIWKDFKEELSKQIDEKYLNNDKIFRYELDKRQMYEFRFNEQRQKNDQLIIENNVTMGDNEKNETKEKDADCLELDSMHKMVYYAECIREYFIQRVGIKHKNNSFMNPTIWKGPARHTFGDKIMTLYHVTDKTAADIISKTRTMKCGKIGRFGGGIYFAEKITTAQGRAKSKGYVITARVLVGKEYIIEPNDSGQFDGTLNFEKLQNKQCDSVYAINWPERVVYHSDQVCIVDIKKMSAFSFIFNKSRN